MPLAPVRYRPAWKSICLDILVFEFPGFWISRYLDSLHLESTLLRGKPSSSHYLLMLGIFAAMPLFVNRSPVADHPSSAELPC